MYYNLTEALLGVLPTVMGIVFVTLRYFDEDNKTGLLVSPLRETIREGVVIGRSNVSSGLALLILGSMHLGSVVVYLCIKTPEHYKPLGSKVQFHHPHRFFGPLAESGIFLALLPQAGVVEVGAIVTFFFYPLVFDLAFVRVIRPDSRVTLEKHGWIYAFLLLFVTSIFPYAAGFVAFYHAYSDMSPRSWPPGKTLLLCTLIVSAATHLLRRLAVLLRSLDLDRHGVVEGAKESEQSEIPYFFCQLCIAIVVMITSLAMFPFWRDSFFGTAVYYYHPRLDLTRISVRFVSGTFFLIAVFLGVATSGCLLCLTPKNRMTLYDFGFAQALTHACLFLVICAGGLATDVFEMGAILGAVFNQVLLIPFLASATAAAHENVISAGYGIAWCLQWIGQLCALASPSILLISKPDATRHSEHANLFQCLMLIIYLLWFFFTSVPTFVVGAGHRFWEEVRIPSVAAVQANTVIALIGLALGYLSHA